MSKTDLPSQANGSTQQITRKLSSSIYHSYIMPSAEPRFPAFSHLWYLDQALTEARKSPPKPTNFRVGCVLVSYTLPSRGLIISRGYTLELPGNTHAEQCALSKFASRQNIPETSLNTVFPPSAAVVLYTTLEPCGKRLSGNTPCVQRIIDTRKGNPDGGIRKVIFGAKEPGTFVQDSQSCRMLAEAGIDWEYVPGLDEEILKVAMEGHEPKEDDRQNSKAESKLSETSQDRPQETNVDNISSEERKRQEALPRNPKKRMMEVPPGGG